MIVLALTKAVIISDARYDGIQAIGAMYIHSVSFICDYVITLYTIAR